MPNIADISFEVLNESDSCIDICNTVVVSDPKRLLRKKKETKSVLNEYYECVFKNGNKISQMEKSILLNNGKLNDNIIYSYASLVFHEKVFVMQPVIASSIMVNSQFKYYQKVTKSLIIFLSKE